MSLTEQVSSKTIEDASSLSSANASRPEPQLEQDSLSEALHDLCLD